MTLAASTIRIESNGAVERKQLLTRLAAARHRTCVLIQGPAGSGKTTLALQWRVQAISYGYDFAIVTVAPGDDTERLADNLFASLNRVDPALSREASFVYNRNGGGRSPEPAAIAVVRALTAHPRDIVLVIDDYHLIQDERVHSFFQILLDLAPPNLHLLIASRSTPPVSLARLRDQGELLEIGFSDLRFSVSETEELLLGQKLGLSAGDARTLYDMTDGWAAGLHLVSLDLRNRRAREKVDLQSRVRDADGFRKYFNENVLAYWSQSDIDALATLAVVQRFDQGLCSALFGPASGQELLERLQRHNAFLIPLEGAERAGWYRFHPLLRDQLNELFDALPADERRRAHAAAGESFGRRGFLREAVHHSVAAGEADRAADWVQDSAQSLFLRGELRLLVRAVAELPESTIRARSSLRLWVGWAQLCYRQLDACRESIEVLKQTLPCGPACAEHHLTMLKASLALQQDDTEAAEHLLPELEATSTSSDAIVAGGRRNILGWYYGQLNQGPTARAHLAGPPFLLRGGEPLLDSAFGSFVGECLRGYSYVREGKMREGERALREVLRKSESTLGPFCEAAACAAGFLSWVLYEMDDLAALRALLDPRMELIERAGLPDAVICACIMRSRMYQSEGSFQEALADVERLEEIAHRRGQGRALAMALAERVTIEVKSGAIDAAERTVAQLRELESLHAGRRSNAALAVWWHASFAKADCLAALRRDQDALDTLQAMMSSGIFTEKLHAQAQLFARVAVLQGRLRREPEALAEVAKAWRIAQQTGLVRSMLDVGNEVLVLGQRAVKAGLLDEVAEFYLERVTERSSRNGFRAEPPPQLAAVAQLSPREVEILKALAALMPNKRIAQVLNISPWTVKWHLKNLYAKLGVYTRDAAVARGRELGHIGNIGLIP
jgi:LuxR family maltose regulon positive regulatory protein